MEKIFYKNTFYALIIRASEQFVKDGVDFKTKNSDLLQVGFLKHPTNHHIKPHIHINKKRILDFCTEVLIIKKGKVKVIFYNEHAKNINKNKILKKNDLIILFKGGHEFKVLKKCEVLEIKQGPYLLNKDKKLLNVK